MHFLKINLENRGGNSVFLLINHVTNFPYNTMQYSDL